MDSFSYKFADLVDIPALEKILADLYEAARIPSAIIDLEGNFLTGAGWQRICQDFHRQNPEAEKACIKSDTHIRDELQAGEPYAIYECPHGLVDSCCPVIVDGHHLANVFTGQMLHTPLDDEIRERFRRQARKFGFDEDEYLSALSEVPIFPIEKHKSILAFLSNFAGQIAQMGLTKLETLEKAKIIQESEARYRSLFNNKHTVMLLIDPETADIVEANPAACSFYGYTHEELNRMAISDLNIFSREEVREEISKAKKKQSNHFIFQHRLADGAIRDVEVYSEPIHINGRQLLYSIIHDITEKIQAERAMLESEKRLQTFIDNASTPIFLKDSDHKYLLINRQYGKLIRTTQEEIVGKDDYEVLPKEIADLFRSQDEEVWEHNRPQEFQETITLADGEQTFITTKFPLHDSGGEIYAIGGICVDITARKQAEESLIKREAQLAESQIVARLGSWDFNLVSEELEWSEGVYRLFDKEPAEFSPTFDEFARMIHADDLASMQTAFNNALESDATPYHVVVRIINDSNREWSMEAFGKVEREPNGDAIRMFGTAQDITQRLYVEEALAKANEEWHYAMDFFEDAIYLVDLDDKLVRANKTFYQMTGLTPDQAIGRDITSIIHPRGEEVPCPVCAARIARRDAVISMDPDHPDNPTDFSIEVIVKIIRDQAEDPVGVLMCIRDLSRQQEVESLLRQGKEEWEKTFDAMGDIITIQDKDMKIIRTNKAAHDFFEVRPGALNGRYCYEIFRGEDQPCAQCPELETIADCQAHSGTIRHEKLGKTFHVSSSPVFEENGEIKYIVHIAKDITEQKRIEEELFQSHKMEAIGTLAGGIAHDFNNILSAIIGYSELSLMTLPENSQDREHVEQIYKAGNRAKELVKQILSFSRKDNQKMEPFEPSSIIKEALKLMRASLPSSISIKEEISTNCGKILADPTNLHQILVNLCTNALHAIENEKGEIQIKLAQQRLTSEDTAGLSAIEPGTFVVLTVTDSGCGMDESTMSRIFEPYFTTKSQGKGTGMGLAVVHGIVQGYGGTIKVRSEPGQGTTFELYFPAIENVTVASAREETGLSGGLPHGNERIMVVDDEEAIIQMEKMMLESLGYQVTAHVNSLEALEEFRGDPGKFDLIITDQTMPNMSGADLSKEIMAIKSGMPIILCTGYSSMVTEAEAKEIGIKDFAKKPLNVKELAGMVRQVLDNN